MSEETHEEGRSPTILDPNQVAVYYDEEFDYQILMPGRDEDIIPEPAAELVVLAMRLTDDKEFYQDMRDWLSKLEQGEDYRDELPRGDVADLLGASPRHARRMVSALIDKNMLTSNSPRDPLRLAFPATIASRWMPGCF